jgi:streptogramin lyase
MTLRRALFTVVIFSSLVAACASHTGAVPTNPGNAVSPFALQSNAPSPWQEEPNIGVFAMAAGADGHSIWGSKNPGIGRLDIATNATQSFPESWQAVVAGPGGLMWYCDSAGLHTIDDNGNTQSFAEPWSACSAIEVGPDGNLWLSANDPTSGKNEAYRVTPTGTSTEYVLPHDAGNALISGVRDGNVWYTEAASYVAKIAAATGVFA